MKREKNSETIKAVIDRFLKDYKLDAKYLEKQIQHEWKEMLGPVIAKKTTSMWMNDGVLTVILESSVIRDELNYAKDKLKSSLNEKLGKEVIRTIVLK